jgi:hypothetical protein
MSRYEWERGTITIPTAEWPTFRTALIKAHNDRLEKDFADANAALPRIQAAGKGKRGETRVKAQWEALAAYCGQKLEERFKCDGFRLAAKAQGYRWEEPNEDAQDRAERLLNILFTRPEGGKWHELTILRTPKRKDLGLLPLTKDTCIDCGGDASIDLKNATHSVSWSVSDNNRACDRARGHYMARAMFGLLAKVKWTRGSGGTIVGNDEYNRDNDCEGGGGNYVTAHYGPEEKKTARRAFAFR